MADIENMFHQVNVCSKDIDAMRFVWRDNQEQPISDFRMLVHIFSERSICTHVPTILSNA